MAGGGWCARGAWAGLGAALALASLLPAPASADATVTNGVLSVMPASGTQGVNGLAVSFTLSATNTPPLPPFPGPSPTNVAIGTIAATGVTRTSSTGVTATFAIPIDAATGLQDVAVTFSTPGGLVTYNRLKAFNVAEGPGVVAGFSAAPTFGLPPLTVAFTNASTGAVTNRLWSFGDGETSTNLSPVHVYEGTGTYTVSLSVYGPRGSNTLVRADYVTVAGSTGEYVVVDTGQTKCYGGAAEIAAPGAGQAYYGQDAQCQGPRPSYTLGGDGLSVLDNRTGLTWQRSPDTTGDGAIDASDKLTWAQAQARPAALNAAGYGGHSDWRLPGIKELYSLIMFYGTEPSGFSGTDTSGLTPFIDTNVFRFAYGDTEAGERIIDSQYASSTLYVSPEFETELFGVNFADGRIKGYGLTLGGSDKTFFVICVRGNERYGFNLFIDNGDGTITDKATGLMWTRADSGLGMNWSNALAWVQARNATNHLGHGDWRLPNAKELQSIIDYGRSPYTTGSAAIDPVFACSAITNEKSQLDYPWFWSSTTHATYNGSGAAGAYVCFGRALGYMNSQWVDIHGAGCQRSDPKVGSLGSYTYVPSGYYNSLAPQGDAVRIFNYVRLVRDDTANPAWRFAFVGDSHTPLSGVPAEIAAAVVGDGVKLVIVAGDLVEVGTGSTTNLMASRLAAWSNVFASVWAAGIPVYAVRGNHENDVAGNLEVWNGFFGMPGNGPAGESNLTYSFACSNALFLACDNYVSIHRVNQNWLEGQLAANARPHVFAFGHEPAFKVFHADCLDDYPAERDKLWSSLAGAGARAYLCGHDHLFNVARIDEGDGDPSNDLYQVVAGTGGSTNWIPGAYGYTGSNSSYTPLTVASVTGQYGYLLVEVSGPGTNDLGVTMTWKQRTYDTNTSVYSYVAVSNVLAYTAADRHADSVGDGIPDWWRARYFGGSGTTTDSLSCASADSDGDGVPNSGEYGADTDPTNGASKLILLGIAADGPDVGLTWCGGRGASQVVECSTSLPAGVWSAIFTNAPPTSATNVLVHRGAGATGLFYRVQAGR